MGPKILAFVSHCSANFKLILDCFIRNFKVDREDHFLRSGFLHIIICVFLGYIALNFVKILDVTDIQKNQKFEGFDRKSRPWPF